ncbi:MAG: glycosyltransferase family 4 protein [Ginsengibacter sp.]
MANNLVLFISPTPTHPSNAGNRQHIKSLVSFFKEQNWEVHFLYLAYEDYDEEQVRSFFGANFHVISKSDLFQSRKTFDYVVKKIKTVIGKQIRKLQFFAGSITNDQLKYNNEVDNYFSVFIKPGIRALQKKYRFEAVVCEYAYLSKSLTFFDKSVVKMIDTHDRFTDRFQSYLNNNLQPAWISLFKAQEKKALRRADVVLAVNKEEAEYFSYLSGAKTAVFNYVPTILSLPTKSLKKKLLYIASSNEINLATIQLFIKNIFPLILKKHPDTTLIIGGSICKKLKAEAKNIVLHGIVEELKSFYTLGDIVINPETSGTGYKVKTMEALSFGMPMVATKAGAVGVTDPWQDHLLIGDSPQEFADCVDLLFRNPELLKQTSENALDWVLSYKENMRSNLMSVIGQIIT